MGAIDLSAFLWPDLDQGRLPQTSRLRINRDNALGKRVAYHCPLGRDLVDVVTGKQATNNGSTLALAPTGPERNFVPGSSQYITLPSSNIVSGYPLTVAGEVNVISTDSAGYVLYSLCGSTYKAILGCGDISGKWLVNVTSSPGLNGCTANTGRQRFLCIHRNGSFDLYINGVLQSQSSVGGNWGEPAAGNHAIGQRLNGSTPRYFSGGSRDFTVFSGELSAAEIASYFADPRQFLSVANQSLYMPPPPAAGTMAASGGAIASGTGALSAGSNLSATGSNVVSGSAALATGVNLSGAGMVTGSGSAALGANVLISSPADRGTLDLPNCSVVANGLTPTINVKNRYFFEGANGARNCFFQVTGVNGMTPVFDCDKSNTEGTWAQKWKFSYTGLLGSWVDFDNFSSLSSPNVYRSSHNTAFTQDSVYVSMHYPWRVGYTLPWLQSLVASGFVSEPPSSAGNTFRFATRSATDDGATDGSGSVIAAQPLYSARISSGGLAPDGLPKRRVVLLGGVHCSEDTGNYVLKGAVEYILSGAADAVTYRAWFDTDFYPLVSSAGRAGGGQRGDFQTGHRSYDSNRHWLESTMETIVDHKTAILGDAGTDVKVMFDFHSTHLSTSPNNFIEPSSSVVTKWTDALHIYEPSVAVTTQSGSGSLQFSSWWAINTLGTQYCITPEITNVANITQSALELYGQHHIQAIASLAAGGEFASNLLSASGAVQVGGSGALSAAVALAGAGAVVASGTADGRVAVTLSAAGLAQAAGTAGLSSQVLLAGAAAAQASGNSTLAAMLNALASGASVASGSATISGGAPVGTLQANGSEVVSGTAQLRVTVYLSAGGSAASSGTAAIAGPPLSNLSGAGTATSTGSATAAVAYTLHADAFVRAMGTGTLSFTFDGELLQPGPLVWRAVEAPRYYTVREARAA